MSVAPLDGIRVLDLSGEIGAYGSKLLADFGADVVKVEPIGGDRQRQRPPFAAGHGDDVNASLVFAYYNSNKRSVELDLADPGIVSTLRQLARGCDVVVIAPAKRQPTPGWDVELRSLPWVDDDAIVCCLTPFGLDGPYAGRRATHFTAFAASGQMHAIGPAEGPPRAVPGNPVFDELSAHAAATVMLALRERPTVGGQLVELSMHDLMAYRDTAALSIFSQTGTPLATRALGLGGAPPSGVWELRDGRIEFAVVSPPHWDGFVELLGSPAELADLSLRTNEGRAAAGESLSKVIAVLLSRLTVDDTVSRAQHLRVPCAAQNTLADLVADEHLRGRGYWVERDGADTGTFVAPGAPFIPTTPLLRASGRAPLLGEHNAELLAERQSRPTAAVANPGRRIHDLKVISFGTAIAGNVSATILAEMGADVVKVESPIRPDPLRNAAMPPGRVVEPSGITTNLMYAGFSRSGRSVALDMNDPADREVFFRLAAKADVLIDNFATGVMAKWNFTHQSLAELNPRLIMATVSGYGRTGPRSTQMAYAATVSSFLGLTRAWATHGMQFDYTAVAHVLPAVFAALFHRDRTGKGSIIDVSQIEAGAAMFAPLYLGLLNGDTTSPEPNSVPGSLLAGVFKCAGHDDWLAVELEDAADWNVAARLLGCPELTLPGLNAPSKQMHAALGQALTDWASTNTPRRAAAQLQIAGLAANAVMDTPDECEDAQLWARQSIGWLNHPDLGPALCAAPFQRMQRTSVHIRRPSARLGEHTQEVLDEWLGFAAGEELA